MARRVRSTRSYEWERQKRKGEQPLFALVCRSNCVTGQLDLVGAEGFEPPTYAL
ncbi:hypothetical protein THIX_30192 [Thiomonas sp. X19]|nr:hypothetical protein THIX_30192 [Thiomonas sp. X19]